MHASKDGLSLDALVQFGTITGLDPVNLGAGDSPAQRRGISDADAVFLGRLAAEDLGMSLTPVPEPGGFASMVAGLLTPCGFARMRVTR